MKNQEEIMDYTEELLKGKTMKIYWYLLCKGESGVREIQRALKFSTPGTVAYHIKKLEDVGLVSQSTESDKYFIEQRVRTGIFGLYIKIGHRMIPRIIFYLSFCTVGVILYFLHILVRSSIPHFYTEDILFLFFSLSAIAFFLYEAFRISTMKPL
ncbi:MAG: winged helix-turn-helix domain-containing protein [Promethearchaeota archaeon]